MNFLMTLFTAILTGIVQFFVTIVSPAFWAQLFATISSRLRSRGNAPNPNLDDPAAVNTKAARRKLMVVVAVLVIVGCWIWLFLAVFPFAPKINRRPFVGLGQVLGEEIVKTLGDQGHPKTPREWFDRYFHVITPQNYTTQSE